MSAVIRCFLLFSIQTVPDYPFILCRKDISAKHRKGYNRCLRTAEEVPVKGVRSESIRIFFREGVFLCVKTSVGYIRGSFTANVFRYLVFFRPIRFQPVSFENRILTHQVFLCVSGTSLKPALQVRHDTLRASDQTHAIKPVCHRCGHNRHRGQ